MRREVLASILVVFGVLPIAGAMAQSKPPAPPAAASPSATASGSATLESVSAIPQQVVWLRSGAVIRGEVVEYVPDTRVVLQLATGEVRTILWDEVERASWVPDAPGPKSLPVPTASGSSPSEPAPKPEAKPGSSAGILLHLEGDRPGLRLEVRPRYGEGTWTPLCNAPCA